MRLYNTDEASASEDFPSQELVDNSDPASSDVVILPKKFLNRNPRYVRCVSEKKHSLLFCNNLSLSCHCHV